VTVQSDLIANVLPATVVDALHAKVLVLNAELPVGYMIVPGGTVEESAKSTSSGVAVVPAALLIMLVVLMIQLQSFSRLFLVLSVAPFGLIGVVAALLIAESRSALLPSWASCTRRHDRSQFSNPGGPDRYGDRARAGPMGCCN
jgi:multidrug efflux pump subunit AcrB